jgi:DNA invertase Pin-like site-specific DNA recombinase
MQTQTRKVRVVCFYGAKNGNAKLTARQVRQIRSLYATGNETCRSLAEKFNVGRQTVNNVIERVIWRGVAV